MNIIVIGPQMEERPLPDYSLRPVPKQSLSAVEILVTRIGEKFCKSRVIIIGLPWVNPRGRGKLTASLYDYLEDPIYLRRALEVAFIAPRATYRADGALIAADSSLEKQLNQLQNWVLSHLSPAVPSNRIVWHSFDPVFEATFCKVGSDGATKARDLANTVSLSETNITLRLFCDAVRVLFQ